VWDERGTHNDRERRTSAMPGSGLWQAIKALTDRRMSSTCFNLYSLRKSSAVTPSGQECPERFPKRTNRHGTGQRNKNGLRNQITRRRITSRALFQHLSLSCRHSSSSVSCRVSLPSFIRETGTSAAGLPPLLPLHADLSLSLNILFHHCCCYCRQAFLRRGKCSYELMF
jgi:hypothetical protein